MNVITNWEKQNISERPKTFFTIGSFDGLHLGHRYIIEKIIKKAKSLKAQSLVLTFEPHPLQILAATAAPPILTTLEQKIKILSSWGLDTLGVLAFNKKMAALSPSTFLQKIIEHFIKPMGLAIGPDFTFGRNAEGNFDFLEKWARNYNFQVLKIDNQISNQDGHYSSSQIRQALKEGLVEVAARALGRPYQLSGQVEQGLARGRLLGFPTANLGQIPQLIPDPGVYAVWAQTHRTKHAAMCSIGYNPTFNQKVLTVEAHLLDFEGDLYGQQMTLDFVGRLRGMVKFNSIDDLVAQMKKDEETTRTILLTD